MREGRTRPSLSEKELESIHRRKQLESEIAVMADAQAFVGERALTQDDLEALSGRTIVELGATLKNEKLFLTTHVVGPKLILADGINNDFPQLSKASICVALPGGNETIDPDRASKLCVLARDFPIPPIR